LLYREVELSIRTAGQLPSSPSKAVSEHIPLAAFSSKERATDGWQVLVYADDRHVIELAKASKSLEEAARIMKRKPERIRKVAMRLGVSFKTEKKK
jgi:hypothetical protein